MTHPSRSCCLPLGRFKEPPFLFQFAHLYVQDINWTGDETRDPDNHQLASGGPSRVSDAHHALAAPLIFDLEALRASAHLLRRLFPSVIP